jgi:DNA-binding transcriptional ArsR family regulator
LSELNHNIRRYVERATKQTDVTELLRMQFDDYSHTLGPAYHALKTSDHVSRYRRGIVNQAQKWLFNEKWLKETAEELALQSRFTPAQAEQEIAHYLDFIVDQLEGLDPLIADIDARHAQYLRTSLRQVRYQLSSADGNFKDRLASLAQHLSALRQDGMIELPEDSPQLRQFPVKIPDSHGFYTPPQKRAPFIPNNILSPVLAPADLALLRADTIRDVTQAFSPDKVNRKALAMLGKLQRLSVTKFPEDVRDDLHWLTTIIAYAHHPEVEYGLDIMDGDAVSLGGYRVMPFELIKL